MIRSKNGPRSNFSLLPFEVQYKIIGMLQDGATFAAIAADPEIAEAYRVRGLKLVAPAMTRLKQSEQYKSWTAQRIKERDSIQADRLTTAFLRENDSLDTIAEQTKVALLKVVQSCVDGTDDPKEVERLVRSAVTLNNSTLARKLEAAERKIEERDRQHEAAELEWKNREAELLAEIEQKNTEIASLRNDGKSKGVSEKTITEIEQKIGLL